tara:strand:- start:209 stop:610 length:402 start_codon:yes stop_codon:yes gene_type:complete
MPVERISQGFKDVSASFKTNPLSGDLIALKNETAIARSIRNLVLTDKGERFFADDLGSRVNSILFELVDDISANAIKEEIITTIETYEPRVDLISVKVNPDYDNNSLAVAIRYQIVGIDASIQQLSFALQPAR